MELYIMTVDWYDDNTGHNIQVYEVTDDFDKAKKVFKEYVDSHRERDLKDGYTVMDDYETLYYAHGTMPNYHRVQISLFG
jgi:hypothetical protein